jgi:dynein heavy chain
MVRFDTEMKNKLFRYPQLFRRGYYYEIGTWSEDALKHLGDRVITDFDIHVMTDEEYAMLIQILIDIYNVTRRYYREMNNIQKRNLEIGPIDFLRSIKHSYRIHLEKSAYFGEYYRRLKNGVDMIKKSDTSIKDMHAKILMSTPYLEQENKHINDMILQITQESELIMEKEKSIKEDTRTIKEQQKKIEESKKETETELDKVIPTIKRAQKALSSISRAEVTEMKTFTNPPPAVRMVIEAVCILLREHSDWDNARKVLQDIEFIARLKKYDKKNVSMPILNKLKDYTQRPEFAPEQIQAKSASAKCLAVWVLAIEEYAICHKTMEPKYNLIMQQTMLLGEKSDDMKKKLDEITTLKQRLDHLHDEHLKSIERQKELKREMILYKKRLENGEKILELLKDENSRWIAELEKMEYFKDKIFSSSILSACYLTYLGPFNESFRAKLVHEWI